MKRPRAIAIVLLLLGAGVVATWNLVPSPNPARPSEDAATPATIWTCSMHPQIRLPKPGRCPICGMQLVPASSAATSGGEVVLGAEAQEIAGVEVVAIVRQRLEHELREVGRIEPSEPHVAYLTAWVDGRVERTYVDFAGTRVAQGDHLVEIYSPDLVVAQEELLRAPDRAPAREKLRLLGVTEPQIEALEQSQQPAYLLTIHAPIAGTVLEKSVRPGMYVKTGDALYTIADLSTVWLLVDVYEQDLPWVRLGQEVHAEIEAAPGDTFAGRVAFIDPVVHEMTRTTRMRINLPNPEGLLKPGMFARATVRAVLAADGKGAAAIAQGPFLCPMHPEVVADAPGKCRICGMELVANPQPPGGARNVPGELLAVPATAVLDTGVRQVVFVERGPGRFEATPVVIGPRAGELYPVLAGLAEGDRVVVQGGFLLDSQAQIEGKPSLLFPAGVTAGGTGHEPAGHR